MFALLINKIRNYSLVIFLAIIIALLSAYIVSARQQIAKAEHFLKMDVSVRPSVQLPRNYKVHLVTYADGHEIHFRNQNALLMSAINQGFDVLYAYNASHLDDDFKNKNQHILKQQRGAGYWLWKPYVILKTLNTMPEDDILVYLDSGVLLDNPDGYKTMHILLEALANSPKSIFLRSVGHTNRKYIKRDLLHYMDMNTEYVRNQMQVYATMIFVKNTAQARELVAEWLEINQNENLSTDKPSVLQEYPDFEDHRHDQAILTLLSYKYPEICEVVGDDTKFSSWINVHRRRAPKMNESLFTQTLTHLD